METQFVVMPWRRTRLGFGIAALVSTPIWKLVGHTSTIQTLVGIGKFAGPTMLNFIGAWGWAFSAPLGFFLLWLTLRRKPTPLAPPADAAKEIVRALPQGVHQPISEPPSVPSDLRIRDGRSRIGRLEIINSRGPAADLSNANVDIDHFTIRNDPPSPPKQSEDSDGHAASMPALPDLPYSTFEELRRSTKILATILQERERWWYEQWKQVMTRGNQWPTDHSVEGLESAEAKERVTKLLEERKKSEYLGLFSGPACTLWSRLCLDLGLSKDDSRFADSPFITNSLEGDWTMARVGEELVRLANLL